MKYASSDLRTWSAARSTSEYTATVAMPISRQAAMMRTAISPRLAIRIFLNIRSWTYSAALILPVGVEGVLLSMCVCWWRAGGSRPAGRARRPSPHERKNLLVLIHDNTACGLFFHLGFFGGHGLVDPLVGGLQIGGAGRRVVALDIGAFPVHQVQVGHGIVVVRTKLDRLVQIIDTFLNVGGISLSHRGADLLVLGRQRLVGLHAEFGTLFLTRHVGLRPVDDSDRIIRLGVIRIDLGGLLVILLGQVKFLHLQIEIGDTLDAVDVPGIDLQHLLVLLNRLLTIMVVLGGVGTRNVLLSKGRGQIQAGIDE